MSDLKHRDALSKILDIEKDLREIETACIAGFAYSFAWDMERYALARQIGVMSESGRFKPIMEIIEIARKRDHGVQKADFLEAIAFGLSEIEKIV